MTTWQLTAKCYRINNNKHCVQVVKENRIQIRAKNYEKTKERQSKNKFTKDYDLGEKIETFSLQGGLTAEGKLIISAYAKGHGPADD